MRLNDEPVAVSFDRDEPVQSYGVEEIEFHGLSIDCKNANVRFHHFGRFRPIPDIGNRSAGCPGGLD